MALTTCWLSTNVCAVLMGAREATGYMHNAQGGRRRRAMGVRQPVVPLRASSRLMHRPFISVLFITVAMSAAVLEPTRFTSLALLGNLMVY